MKKVVFDWLVVGLLFIFLITFVTFVHARGGVITGKILGANVFENACESYSGFERIAVGNKTLNLCADRTHSIDFITLESNDARIQCNGSTIQGQGGALFVPARENARVTMVNCTLRGFDGLYQNVNPVRVNVE